MGPIHPLVRKTGTHYIITATKYLTMCAKAHPVKDCSAFIDVKFMFEYILSRFGCTMILMSDRGSHFLNEMIASLLKEFQMYHHKSMAYHPQINGTVEAFNKILENDLTKIYNVNKKDWDVLIPSILWAYRTTRKKLTRQTPFRLVYGQ